MARFILAATLVVVSVLAAACSSEQASQEQDPNSEETGTPGDNTSPSEERTDVGEDGSNLAELLNDPAYKVVTDGALSVEVPSGWEVATGEDSEMGSNRANSNWSSLGSVGSSITASTNLYAWHNTSGAPGMYIVASRELAQQYADDQLVASGPNDFSSSCGPGARRDFDRLPYAGKMQAWKDCGGNVGTNILTLVAAPESRECVVLLQIGLYSQADVEIGQHILDTFEVDCRLVSSSEASQETGAPAEEEPTSDGDRDDPNAAPGPATGVLEKPEATTYMYGTHAITDEASRTRYALRSEDVDLDAYVGERVTVHGTLVPGYESGQIEGGPPLLNVTRIEPA